MEKKNYYLLFLLGGLAMLYGLISLLVFITRRKGGTLIKKKIAIGTLLLSLSALFSGTAYAQQSSSNNTSYTPTPTISRFVTPPQLVAAEAAATPTPTVTTIIAVYAAPTPTRTATPVYGTRPPTASATGPIALYAIFTPVPTATVSTLGDVNNDAKVDIIDALMVARYSVGLQDAGFMPERADVDGSGTINVVDALMIAQKYVGLITQFPNQ